MEAFDGRKMDWDLTIAKAFALWDSYRASDPSARIETTPTMDGNIFVQINGEDVTMRCAVWSDPEPCKHCEELPCVVKGLRECLEEEFDRVWTTYEQAEDPHPRIIRNALYRKASYELGGSMGKGNRKKLPDCVVHWIRDLHPNPHGQEYVGFQSQSSVLDDL